LSPDGQLLAYAAESGDSQHVVVRDLMGDGVDTVATILGNFGNFLGGVVTLEWSPDGKRLLAGAYDSAMVLPRVRGPARTFRLISFPGYAYWASSSRVSLHWPTEKHVTLFDTAQVGDSVVIPVGGQYDFLAEGSWSPDGRHFAVTTRSFDTVSFGRARFGISIVGPETRRTEPVVEDTVPIGSPRWSPDGTIVYYARSYNELRRIRVDPRTGRPRGTSTLVQRDLQMVPGWLGLAHFSINPEGRRFVYPRGSRFSNIYVVEPGPSDTARQGSMLGSMASVSQLTHGTALRWTPRVSPDGRWIAFAERKSGSTETELFRVPIDGGPVERLTFGARVSGGIAWSPDGKQIAFATHRGNHAEIWIADVDGRRMRGLEQTRAANPGTQYELAWAPGANIAYERYDDRGIALVDPVTGNERTLVNVSSDTTLRFESPLYFPDGKRLAVTRESLRLRSVDLWMFDLSKGTSAKVADGVGWPESWSSDGRYMYTSPWQGRGTLDRIDATGRTPPVPYWTLPFRMARCIAAGPRRPGAFVCVKFDFVSDISVIENFDR